MQEQGQHHMSNLPVQKSQTSQGANTDSFFNNYYKTTLPVNSQKYDAVLTFFLKKTEGNRVAAEALTASLMVIAQSRGVDPMGIVEEFKKFNDDESFKSALIALLNSGRRSTSKLGYAITPESSPYIVRNIGR